MKGDYFDGGSKVPGFIVSPVFKENDLKRSTFDETVHFADLMVSLLGLADPTESLITDQLDGLNLWKSLIEEDGSRKRRETIYHIDQSPKPVREIQSNVFLQHANWRFNQSLDSSRVYSAALRVDEYKYIKAVKNVRKNMYPFSAINEDWTWQSPSEITPPVMIQNRFGMPFISEEYDYWLFNLEQDPMESVNLLSFESLTEKEYLILSEMEEILASESRRMMPQIATERYKSEVGVTFYYNFSNSRFLERRNNSCRKRSLDK